MRHEANDDASGLVLVVGVESLVVLNGLATLDALAEL